MILIRDEAPADAGAREALLDRAFGPARFMKTCERLRERRLPAQGLSFAAEDADGRLLGTLRFWHVALGGRPGLMLGPLAVDEAARGLGLGSALMAAGLERARQLGHEAVMLVGDAAYYGRFGFSADRTGRLTLPGWVDRARVLALELVDGALAGAEGPVRATGAIALPFGEAPRLQPRRAA